MQTWTREMLTVEPVEVQRTAGPVQVLRHGTPLWYVVQGIGEQVIAALDDLGYTRTDTLGQVHGFKIKELAVTPTGDKAVIHLDVTDQQLFQPAAPSRRAQGKPVPYMTLVSNKVVEQIRIRISEMLGGRIEVVPDNHYWIRYVADLAPMFDDDTSLFPGGNLVDHLQAAPGPFHIPLGYDTGGVLHWHDIRCGKHVLLTGITGAGKTTWIDGAITTLVRTTAPDDLHLVFLDPQRLNFSPYAALTDYHYTDHEGSLGNVWQAADLVRASARLNAEHLRRTDQIAATPWGSLEDYNAHSAPDARLPYIVIFTDELTLMRAMIAQQLGRKPLRTFDANLNALVIGARKVGIRLFLCLQYLKHDYLPRETAAQAGLILAFHNTPQGSRNTLGDSEATLLRQPGRFVAEGLPDGRAVLQGLYISREEVLDLLTTRDPPPAFPVDGLVQEMLGFILNQLDGALSRDPLAHAFSSVLSTRQVTNFIHALDYVGLVAEGKANTFPPDPKHLAVGTLEQALDVLRYHPEICFHAGPEGRYIFGPE